MTFSLGYITAPTKTEAKKIVRELFRLKLIACANILPAGESMYVWKGRTRVTKEVVVIIKTRISNEEKIISAVKKTHSYECPCILFLALSNGNKDFLRWADSCC